MGELAPLLDHLRSRGIATDALCDISKFDADGDGCIDREELKAYFRNALGERRSNVEALMTESSEFTEAMNRVWKYADDNGNGTIDGKELNYLLQAYAAKFNQLSKYPTLFSDEDIAELLKLFDADG